MKSMSYVASSVAHASLERRAAGERGVSVSAYQH